MNKILKNVFTSMNSTLNLQCKEYGYAPQLQESTYENNLNRFLKNYSSALMLFCHMVHLQNKQNLRREISNTVVLHSEMFFGTGEWHYHKEPVQQRWDNEAWILHSNKFQTHTQWRKIINRIWNTSFTTISLKIEKPTPQCKISWSLREKV